MSLAYIYLNEKNNWRVDSFQTIPNLQTVHRDVPIVHVSWSSTGQDLACADAHGEVSVYASTPTGVMSCLFHPASSALATTDLSASELNQIVGFQWFEIEKPVLIASAATLTNRANNNNNGNNRIGNATYGVSQALPMGPFHPINGKQACIAVSKRGLVRVIFQNPVANRYIQAVGNLGLDTADSSSYISHASFRGYRDSNNTILLVTYAPGQVSMSVYRITLTWTMPAKSGPQNAPQNQRQNPALSPNQSTQAAPQVALDIQLLTTEVLTPNIPKDLALTHLVALPSVPQKNVNAEQEHKVDVYAVFGSEKRSVIFLYSIQSQTTTLHPSIYSLTTRRDSYNEEPEIRLVFKEALGLQDTEEAEREQQPKDNEQSEDPVIPSLPVITSIALASNDMFLTIASADGHVSMKYRGPNSSNVKIITSPTDAGLSFKDSNSPDNAFSNDIRPTGQNNVASTSDGGKPEAVWFTDIAISPSLFAIAYLRPVGISVRRAHAPSTDWYCGNENNHITQAAVALAARHAAACFSSLACDDILSVMTSELATKASNGFKITTADGQQISQYRYFLTMLLQESHRSVNFSFDLPRDYQIDKLMMHPSLQRLLSMQLVLGTSGPGYKRNIMGISAWITLNIRLAAFALTFVVKSCGQPKQDLTLKVSQLMSLKGLVRWCIDLIAYLCQELYEGSLAGPAYWFASSSKTKPNMDSSIVASILCTSIPRQLLLYTIRCIRSLDPITEGLCQEYSKDPAAYANASAIHGDQTGTVLPTPPIALRSIRETLSMAPVPIDVFEKLLKEGDSAMQKIAFSDKLQCEQKMFFEGVASTELMPVMARLIDVFRNIVSSGLDVSRLYFFDVSWLGLNRQLDEIDVLRKTVLGTSAGLQCRRCTRCGGRSTWTDVKSMVSASASWTVVFQKSCMCGGNWIS